MKALVQTTTGKSQRLPGPGAWREAGYPTVEAMRSILNKKIEKSLGGWGLIPLDTMS